MNLISSQCWYIFSYSHSQTGHGEVVGAMQNVWNGFGQYGCVYANTTMLFFRARFGELYRCRTYSVRCRKIHAPNSVRKNGFMQAYMLKITAFLKKSAYRCQYSFARSVLGTCAPNREAICLRGNNEQTKSWHSVVYLHTFHGHLFVSPKNSTLIP
jgi:hypothetical protein